MSDVSIQPDTDAAAVQVAMAAEELKRTQALERHAVEAGDTKWILNIADSPTGAASTPLKIVHAGYIAIDSPAAHDNLEDTDDVNEEVRPRLPGRRSFGKFNRVLEVGNHILLGARIPLTLPQRQRNPEQNASSSESSDENEASAEEDEKSSERAAELRAQRKARRKEEKAEASQMAEKRRGKGVKLNKLNSISSGGGSSRPAQSAGKSDQQRCYNCNQPGHQRRDCPRGSDGRPPR